ncbi:MAG TPA: S24/S26 family peptidase [Candidatus Saccharimonadales bacterium]|nr:S24/S26 family peptidase [Candidatus Saccharimonadales bacterium]
MLYVRRVVGASMEPILKSGRICVFLRRRRYTTGHIVIARVHPDGEVVKYLHGDHLVGANSRSSRYVLSDANQIVGKLIWPRVNRQQIESY